MYNPQTKNNVERKEKCWQRIERCLLILTFICTLVATLYSVRISRKAILQANNALRPWVSIESVDTFFKEDHMETRFKIVNIGQIPAHLMFEIEGYHDGKKLSHIDNTSSTWPAVIMPGQIIWGKGAGVKGKTYQNILKKNFTGELIQSIRINYDSKKNNELRCFTFQKIKFDIIDLPKSLRDSQHTGLWDHIESDFR